MIFLVLPPNICQTGKCFNSKSYQCRFTNTKFYNNFSLQEICRRTEGQMLLLIMAIGHKTNDFTESEHLLYFYRLKFKGLLEVKYSRHGKALILNQRDINNDRVRVQGSKIMRRRSISMSLSYDIIPSVSLAYSSVKPVSRYDSLIIG
jgi:hypothetical protein